MTEQNEGESPVSAELVLARQKSQLEIWQQRAELDIERERMMLQQAAESGLLADQAHARALAASELVPGGFRIPKNTTEGRYAAELNKAAANILLAREMGRRMGYDGFEALQHLEVIEGRVALRNQSARAKLLAAGCRFVDEFQTNGHGITVACTVILTRPDAPDQPEAVRFTLLDAARMRLCRPLRTPLEPEEDQEDATDLDEIRAVKSSKDNWRLHWPDMLNWRAFSRVVKRYASDLVNATELAAELEQPAAGAPEPSPRAARQLTVAPAASDQVAADLELAGPEWWQHAGATVRRRSKAQMAADRLMDAYQRDPENFTGPTPPADQEPQWAEVDPETGVVAAEIVDDEPDRTGDSPYAELPDYPPPDAEGEPYPDPAGGAHVASWPDGATPERIRAAVLAGDKDADRAKLLVLLDDYVQRTGMDRDKLTLRSRAVLAPPAGPVPEVDALTTDQLAEMLDALGPVVDTWSTPPS